MVVRATPPTPTESKAPMDEEAMKKKYGFRWDPVMQRWLRDDRVDYKDSAENTVITPKTGGSYVVWPVAHCELMEYGLESLSQEAVKAAVDDDSAVVVDVRHARDYAAGHIAGSISVPMFVDVQGDNGWAVFKRISMAAMNMNATERDPDFAQKVFDAVGPDTTVIVACSTGGTMDTKLRTRLDKYPDGFPDNDRNFGRESRSLKAAYELVLEKQVAKVAHLDGGIQRWRFNGLPMEA